MSRAKQVIRWFCTFAAGVALASCWLPVLFNSRTTVSKPIGSLFAESLGERLCFMAYGSIGVALIVFALVDLIAEDSQ